MMSATENPYLLLTPGPLSTSKGVRQAMLKDWCTWDDDYNKEIVEDIRFKLVALATKNPDYTSVLLQGSGTASVEATIGTAVGRNDCLLIISNGAYGLRIIEIARYLGIKHLELHYKETESPTAADIDQMIAANPQITHVALVHCETTTGILNPLEAIINTVKSHNRIMIVDAMSSFGGMPIDADKLGIDFLISSPNKCIQGVPGFGFVIAKKSLLSRCAGQSRSLSLDLFAQWICMEDNQGKWRFTSPTHTVRAFHQALIELDQEGGVLARYRRYQENQALLVQGMQEMGFKCLLKKEQQSPFITSFYSPEHPDYSFDRFYDQLKQQGFVIYPGKVSDTNCFRIGNIGEVYPENISALLTAVSRSKYWEH